jgi:leucine efflux protein
MPIDPHTLASFLAACLAVFLAPGPDMAYIGANAMAHGFRIGLWAAIGPVIGCMVQAFAAVFGVSAALTALPLLFDAVRWAGVVYLVYLGIQVLRSGHVAIDAANAEPPSPRAAFLKGLAINLLNPKLALFFVAFLPQFVDPERGDPRGQLVVLCLIFVAGAIPWCAFQAYAFARAGRALANNRRAQTWQRRIAGSAFLGFAGVLALSQARS